MTLAALLVLLGATLLPGAGRMEVDFRTDGPTGIRGVACDARFRVVEGHAQALCGDFDGIVVYIDEIDSMGLLLDTLAHEHCHLVTPVRAGASPWVRFSEAKCYAAGAAYAERNAR